MNSLNLAKLTGRKLLRISGPDCYPYLQGLLSNDLRYLYEPDRIPKRKFAIRTPNVLSTFMLNPQGRAICDLIVYRTPFTKYACEFTPPGKATEPDELLIECDASIANGLGNTLYGYRVRRKIEILTRDDLTIWSLFPKSIEDNDESRDLIILETEARSDFDQKQLIALEEMHARSEIISDKLTIVGDPRLTNIGLRVLSSENSFEGIKRKLESIIGSEIVEASQKSYVKHRYALGVGEGTRDHPESNCLPLECNADLLNSVCFDKGCYLGQELTARIHHTGVIRKRLMPVELDKQSTQVKQAGFIEGSDIVDNNTGKKVGHLRNVVGHKGLALLRHEQALSSDNLIHDLSKTKIVTYRPFWWNN